MHRKLFSAVIALLLTFIFVTTSAFATGAVSAANATARPTATVDASAKPSATARITSSATAKPTSKATQIPTSQPTAMPTLAPTAIPTVEPTATPEPLPIPMQLNDQGDAVKQLQIRLRTLGFLTDGADGYFGPLTQKAVKAFQQFANEHMGVELHYIDPNATPEPTAEATIQPTLAPTEKPTAEPTPKATAHNYFGNSIGKPNSSAAATPIPTLAPTAVATAVPTPEPTPYVADGIVNEQMYTIITDDSFKVYYSDLEKGAQGSDVTRLQTRLSSLYYLGDSIDGIFGGNTQSALKYFQKYNELDQTGIADEQTQLKLYSEDAVPTAKPTLAPAGKDSKGNGKSYSRYKLVIDVSDQRVYVYGYENGAFGPLSRVFVCSTGTKTNPTPLGTFSGSGPTNRWHYFKKFDCWAQYSWRIDGSILFHSVIYNQKDEDTLVSSSVRNLGRRASHGCIRLSVDNAKWIYNNCPRGTTVAVRK